jgi:CheY-like chemotaxis protein
MAKRKSGKILVVDDEQVFAKLLAVSFKDHGYTVECATSAKQAIEGGKTFKPDVLFCDWLLKGGASGVEVARELRRQNPKLKVIVVTGLPDKAEADIGSFPISFLIEKPCSIDDALEAVDSLM